MLPLGRRPYGPEAVALCEIIVFLTAEIAESAEFFQFFLGRSQISYDSCGVAGDDDLIGDIIDYHAASTHNGIGSDGYAAQ